MSTTPWMPDLPGFAWERKRSSRFNTLVQTAASGLENRAALMTLTRREWELPFSYLREGTPWFEVETLEGFYTNALGGLNTFFFRDQFQNNVTTGFIATGDGATTGFQAVRFLQAGSGETGSGSSYFEPVFCFDTRSVYDYPYGGYVRPAGVSPQAFVNGTPHGSTFNTETGVITFGTAPTRGSTITATFSYGFRCRFSEDSLEFDNVLDAINKMDSLKIIQTRV